MRLLLSAAVFLPWTVRLRPPPGALAAGAVQFGLMYVCYIAAFAWLPAWGVALWTIFTPLYVTWLEDLLARRWSRRGTLAALLAIGGAALAQAGGGGLGEAGAWRGVLLVQGSNLCFAAGQVAYRRLRPAPEASLLGWMYVGAVAAAGAAALLLADPARAGFGPPAWLALLYLGVVPTAVGFYLWNKGAARVAAGPLAAANNLKVPLAIAVSWLVFGESASYGRVLAGLAVVGAALLLAQAGPPPRPRGPAAEAAAERGPR